MIQQITHTCEFNFTKLGEGEYRVNYAVADAANREIDSGTRIYRPRSMDKIKDNNDVRAFTNAWLRATILFALGLNKGVKFVCTNPESDFVSRADKMRATLERNKRSRLLVAAQDEPVAESRPTPTASSNGRLFEVVQKNGVWTIIKHESELLTEEEAKTQLFARIVNGD